jgi:uncharacterized membrane protein
MKWLFSLIGLFLGALMGEVPGALVGTFVGLGLAFALSKNAAKPAADIIPVEDADPLAVRLAALEQEIGALKTRLSRLENPEAAALEQTTATTATMAVATPPTGDRVAAPPMSTVPDFSRAALSTAPPQSVSWSKPTAQVVAETPAPAPAEPTAQRPAAVPTPTPASSPEPWESRGLPATSPISTPPVPPKAATPPVPQLSLKERMPAFLRNWIFGGNTIVKVGVLILFFGLAFLLRYAAERVTVPIELRYAGVALVGALLLGVGWRLRHGQDKAGGTGFGQILQGAGIAVFYLTTLGALKLSQLLPPELAFGFLFLTSVFAALLAVAQSAPWLAYVAAAGGFAAPVLASTGGGNHIALFSYLAILDVGIFLVAGFKAWRPLNLIGFTGTFALAGGWAHKYYSDAVYPSTQGFLLLFFALFAATGVLYARRALAREDETQTADGLSARARQAFAQVGRVDSALTFGLPLVVFGLQYLMVRPWEYGPAWAALGFSLFYLLLGGLLLRSASARYALLGEAYVIVSAIFGTLAIPLALGSGWTSSTWAIEAAGMYWLGQRQHRPYTRALALLLMAGAALRLVTVFSLSMAQGTPLVSAPALNLALLAAGALMVVALGRRTSMDKSAATWERAGLIAQLWIAVCALVAIVWGLFTPQWASVATAVLALAAMALHGKMKLPTLPLASAVLHAVALAGLASTLHTLPGATMLSGGWHNLVPAGLIGLCLLVGAGLPLHTARRDALARGTPPTWSAGSSIGVLVAIGVLSLCALFVLPVLHAARLWPWFGLAVIWLGLRLGHSPLVLAGMALQLVSGLVFNFFSADIWSLAHQGITLWTPLALVVAALLTGIWLQDLRRVGRLVWLTKAPVPWGLVCWLLFWWAQVLPPDGLRAVAAITGAWPPLMPALAAAWVLLSSVLIAAIARWRNWSQLGQTTVATLPALALVACLQAFVHGFPPHAHLGWLVWPLAIMWHLQLLRMQPRWLAQPVLTGLHVAGFWLFLLLAARESQGLMDGLAGLGDDGSAWAMLGWALAPTLALFAVSRPRVAQLWPLRFNASAYLQLACGPVAAYLLLWIWASNTQSGSASPLPYLPLLNPLELGQGLVLLALVLWSRALPDAARQRVPDKLVLAGLAATAFAIGTGMVLRTCHHWAGVAWSTDALFDSKLTQAALSVAWAMAGMAAMLLGHKRAQRMVWAVGAGLLGVVVLKLFFVELADRGGLYRIVSFIVVGLLLLVVGYFAPVPPSKKTAVAGDKEAPHAA